MTDNAAVAEWLCRDLSEFMRTLAKVLLAPRASSDSHGVLEERCRLASQRVREVGVEKDHAAC